VFKKKSTDVEWGEPIADVAASGATFSLDDTDLTTGGFTWSWSVVAQDCSPANSSLALSGAITLP
jgi:hypothetical protein